MDTQTTAETFDPAPTRTHRTRTPRHDGWTPERHRDFLAALADGYSVETACQIVGKSNGSAYAFRRRPEGAAFALGWKGALLVQRDLIADTLHSRIIDGQEVTITRADGSTVIRHYHDNRLAAAVLTRLDRQADDSAAGATASDAISARLIAQDFESYLDMVERDEGPARAGLFLAARAADAVQPPPHPHAARPSDAASGVASRTTLPPPHRDADLDRILAPVRALARADRALATGASHAIDIDTDDLDPAERKGWSGEQWLRAEAAGMLTFAGPQESEADSAAQNAAPDADIDMHAHIDGNPLLPTLHDVDRWYDAPPLWRRNDDPADVWLTRFPPPDDFAGHETGRYGDHGYARTLTAQELADLDATIAAETERQRAEEAQERDRYFRWDGVCPAGVASHVTIMDDDEGDDDAGGIDWAKVDWDALTA